MILGPARADTWRIEEKWNAAAEILTAKLKPYHFTWNEATNFWSSTSKVDGWHIELTDENKHNMARWLTDAAEFMYVPYLLRLAMGNQRRDGDVSSDVATEKVNLNYLGLQMQEDWASAEERPVPPTTDKARSADQSALKVASPKGKPQIASPKGKPRGVVDVQEDDKVR